MNYEEFKNKLFENAEEGYRDFVLGGIITERPLLGVRVPKCREIATEVLGEKFGGSDTEKIKRAKKFLENEPMAFEEVLVRGFVIAKLPYQEMIKQIYKFIPLIDNWEICDTFCAAMGKNVRKNRDKFLEEIDRMLESLDEFETRVAIVSLLDHYVEPEYLNVIFDRIFEMGKCLSEGPGELSVERVKGTTDGKRVRSVMAWDAYYVKMAVAWLISVCFAKFPEETLMFFERATLPRWTYNKAINKTCESYRVDRDLKEKLKSMKR